MFCVCMRAVTLNHGDPGHNPAMVLLTYPTLQKYTPVDYANMFLCLYSPSRGTLVSKSGYPRFGSEVKA